MISLLAESEMSLPLWVYATLPLWPLLGAIGVGLLLIGKGRPAVKESAGHGHSTAHAEHGHEPSNALAFAHLPVLAGVAVTAVLGVMLFLDLGRASPATAAHAALPAPTITLAQHDPGAAAERASSQKSLHSHDGVTIGTMVEPVAPAGITFAIYNWISLGADASARSQWIAFNFFFDNLTGVMLLFVTIVSLMVVTYSIGYMRDHHGHPERGYERFFAFLGLFVFSMLMLVLAGNFVLLYLGWEAVGLCSYLLIGFYYKKPEAVAAAKKAFIVNRIGDLGFALGIFSLYMFVAPLAQPGENPLDYAVVFKYASQFSKTQATLASLLLLCGALGKSAQFPLYVWLPDAMEGPSPVSALIHAATMVTAGIYMVARCGPLFAASETALTTIVVLGAIGAVLAATMALTQYDMKRILAYSTISQLAFMFVALGVGATDSGVFHVFTHAFFKALLFLCAGSVMHAMGNVIDLRRFSGLGAILPQTRTLMLIGCLALAGFPLLSGFWSKDEIVHAALEWHPGLGALLLATAGLTAYYTFRMYFLCFHGPLRLPQEAGDHPHEAGPVMLRPLYVLAAGAVGAGYLGVTLTFSPGSAFLGFLQPHGYFHHYLHHSTMVSHAHAGGGVWLMYVSAAVSIGGILLAWMRYGEAPQFEADPDRRALGGAWSLLHAKYYVDELFEVIFRRPLRGLGTLCFGVDRNGIDGLVWLTAGVPQFLGFVLRLFQRGALQGYALGGAAGMALLLLIWKWSEMQPQ